MRPYRFRHVRTLAALLLLCGAGGVFAQTCDVTLSLVNFGFYDPLLGNRVDAAGSIRGRCQNPTGQPLKVHICIGLREGSAGNSIPQRLMRTAAGHELPYQLYKNSPRTVRWGSIDTGEHAKIEMQIPANTVMNLTNTPIYARIPGDLQQSAAPGQYSSNYPYPGQIEADIAFLPPSAPYTCQTPGNIGGSAIISTMVVRARIDPKCNITSPPGVLDFGSANAPNVPLRTNKFQMAVQCTYDAKYSIALDDGIHSVTSGQRRMARGNNYIVYDLYQDNSFSTRWGSTPGGATGIIKNTLNGQPLSGTGSIQTHVGYGRVLPQTATAAGTYEDKVKVTVTY